MQTLVELGADPLLPNAEHTTPLLAAAGVGVPTAEEAGTETEVLEAVALALKLGGDVNAVDDNGETAMHGAAYEIIPRSYSSSPTRAHRFPSGIRRTSTAGRRWPSPADIVSATSSRRPKPSLRYRSSCSRAGLQFPMTIHRRLPRATLGRKRPRPSSGRFWAEIAGC